jgi:hypothetical protein
MRDTLILTLAVLAVLLAIPLGLALRLAGCAGGMRSRLVVGRGER